MILSGSAFSWSENKKQAYVCLLRNMCCVNKIY